jgi:hypothetical protein
MTPQQERIKQATAFEYKALIWTTTEKVSGRMGYKSSGRVRRLTKFYRRMAGNNRRAFKRHGS